MGTSPSSRYDTWAYRRGRWGKIVGDVDASRNRNDGQHKVSGSSQDEYHAASADVSTAVERFLNEYQ